MEIGAERLAQFAGHIGGEFVAGCLIATVDDKRQYLYRDGEFTARGEAAFLEWERGLKAAPVDEPKKEVEVEAQGAVGVAIATDPPKGTRKQRTSVGD